jgi:RNA polymerase sigma factor (sigma-70 family)
LLRWSRHVDKVYSVALRYTRNVHAAEEITKAVFVILTRKANKLSQHAVLSGWLYETTRLTALTFIRSEIRRARREQEAHMQATLNGDGDASSPSNEDTIWPHIAPLLDDVLAGLSSADRHAIVLRYFDGNSLGEVGAAMGASEDAAKKRVTRAVEKLRGFFTKRGVTLTATVLTAAISANSVQAAPLGLAATVTAGAVKGTLISATLTTLVKTTMKTMT